MYFISISTLISGIFFIVMGLLTHTYYEFISTLGESERRDMFYTERGIKDSEFVVGRTVYVCACECRCKEQFD